MLDQFLQKNQFYTTGTHSQLYFFEVMKELLLTWYEGYILVTALNSDSCLKKNVVLISKRRDLYTSLAAANLSLIAVGTM